ncbi:hypothetical protein [Xinfangfangia pollutisoli]|uniref:hypothetical protein n=1 Tax=Xinfangfangia pollutisoli TaxID=2865960 RepID=UPI001CD6131D|nr:hypothetical protein [Xinfangfangia pollutisoli]
MSDVMDPDNGPVRAPNDVPRERLCLRCHTQFPSEGFGERICRRCKGTTSWRSSVQSMVSSGRRR